MNGEKLTNDPIGLEVGFQIGSRLHPSMISLQRWYILLIPCHFIFLVVELCDCGIQNMKQGKVGVRHRRTARDGIADAVAFQNFGVFLGDVQSIKELAGSQHVEGLLVD